MYFYHINPPHDCKIQITPPIHMTLCLLLFIKDCQIQFVLCIYSYICDWSVVNQTEHTHLKIANLTLQKGVSCQKLLIRDWDIMPTYPLYTGILSALSLCSLVLWIPMCKSYCIQKVLFYCSYLLPPAIKTFLSHLSQWSWAFDVVFLQQMSHFMVEHYAFSNFLYLDHLQVSVFIIICWRKMLPH